MTERYEVICTRTHGKFTKGLMYKCVYERIIDDYYKIYFERNDYYYADKSKNYCNLNYFLKVDTKFKLKYFKKSNFVTWVNHAFNTDLNEYADTTKKFDFSSLDKNMFGNVFLNVIMPIQTTFESEFYLYHQDKFDYILSSILKINKMREQLNMTEQISKYEQLIKEVIVSIELQNERVEKEYQDSVIPHIEEYLENENKMLEVWRNGLDEIWK